MEQNIAVVKEFFTALGQGDLPGAVDMVADEVDWQSPVTRTHPPEIPWSSIRRTKAEVSAFFSELGHTIKPERFELLQIIAQNDHVAVEGKNSGTVRKTGSTYEHDWVMIFSIQGGKIIRFRHYYDTADLVGPFRGE